MLRGRRILLKNVKDYHLEEEGDDGAENLSGTESSEIGATLFAASFGTSSSRCPCASEAWHAVSDRSAPASPGSSIPREQRHSQIPF